MTGEPWYERVVRGVGIKPVSLHGVLNDRRSAVATFSTEEDAAQFTIAVSAGGRVVSVFRARDVVCFGI